MNDDQVTDDIASAIDFLRKHPACSNGSVGVVGYCWGGFLAYLTAVRHKPDAAVGYYGVGIDKKLDLAKNLSCPLMLHYAELDQYASPEVAAQVGLLTKTTHGLPSTNILRSGTHSRVQAGAILTPKLPI